MRQQRRRVGIVGSGTRFLSGISYFTIGLANALSASYDVSVILMRQLLPTRFYPGRKRVGAKLTQMEYALPVRTFDGVDWHWVPSMFRALDFLVRERPEVLVLQWWSGTVLHTYLTLAAVTRLLGGRVIIEFHEVLDTGEARLAWARAYVRTFAPLLVRLADGFIIHSEFDRPALERAYGIAGRPVAVIPLGPFEQYQLAEGQHIQREAPADVCNVLFFGVIRPFKGLEDLLRAFDAIPPEEISGFWLTIVGETWEGWTLPTELIAASRYRDRITFVNRYIPDEEVAAFFAGADAVALPYHRSSASGPVRVAMSWGLPLVLTNVGGLPEEAANYDGAILIPPQEPAALLDALRQAAGMRNTRFTNPNSWTQTAARYDRLFAQLDRQPMGAEEVSA
jgi:glycosyltransferase involved in cell wall biosynthesis